MRLVAKIKTEWCDRSPGCPASRVCPRGAISYDIDGEDNGRNPFASGILKVDPAKCTGCGMCASVCPHGAIQIEPAGEDTGRKAAGL